MKNWWSGISKRMYLAVALMLGVLLVGGLTGSDNIGIESGDQMATDSNGGQAYEEVYSAGETNGGIVYIDWQAPKATNEFAGATWFLGAYKYVSDGLCVDLNRVILTNNLRYAIALHYSAGDNSSLYLNLLDTNGLVLAAVSENLLTSSNVVHYVFTSLDAGIQSTNTVLLVNLPTAEYPSAAVIQLIVPSETDDGIFILEGLLYIDEDADFYTATEESRNGTSDYSFDGYGGSISNYYEWINGTNTGSSTNLPGGGGSGGGSTNDPGGGTSAPTGLIFVDLAIGSPMLTGRAPEVRGSDGPKKTISQGLAAVDRDGAHTLIIKSGSYGEDLDLRGKKNLRVVIEGSVRL